MTRVCIAATAGVLCVGRLIATHAAGTSRAQPVNRADANKNREFWLTCSCLAFAARMSVVVARKHMVTR